MEIKHMSQLWIRQISELLWDITMTPKTAFAPSKAELHLQGCSFWRHLPAGWVLQHPSPQGCSSTPVQLLSQELVPLENKRGASLRTTAQNGEGNTVCVPLLSEGELALFEKGLRPTPKQNNMFERKGPFILKDVLLHERPFWYACICLARSTADYSLWNTFQCLRLCFHPKPTVL